MLMELKQLRYFLGVCRHGSIAEAARALHIAQPALSRQMAALEAQLGVSLFTRLPRGVAPTRAGMALQAHARALLGEADRLGEQLRQAELGLAGVLRIGVMPGYSDLPALAAALRPLPDSAPGVQVQVESLYAAEQLQRLRRHELDLGIVAWRSPFDTAFCGLTLREDRMGVAMPPHWPQARQREALYLRDLRGQPLLMSPRERSPVHYDKVQQACSAAGIDPGQWRLGAADTQTTLGLVAAGLGYAIAPLSLADFWGSRICLRPAQDLTIPFTMELVWLAQRADPLVDHFLERWRAACAS
ncbi:LysR family transcriptional regulator [Bordetella trematum]|nr:LysR family transcriptional regulator [Bordetella trematum]